MSDPIVAAPVTALVDAINRADTDAFVTAFTNDGFVVVGDRLARFTIPPNH